MKNVFRLIRPHQYIKNLFLFLPLFFAGQLTDLELFINVCLSFVAFSATASGIYILNDLQDIENVQQASDQQIFDNPYEEQANENSAEISVNQDLSQENIETPNLFSDDQIENKDLTNEVKEPEMFESQDTEEDFEIPAFLRRQRN